MTHDVSYLERYEPPQIKRRRRQRRVFRVSVCVIGLLLVGWMSVLCVALGLTYAAAQEGRDSLMAAKEAWEGLDFDASAAQLRLAEGHFADASRGLDLLRSVKFVPWIGKQVAAADALVSAAVQASGAFADLVGLAGQLARLTGLDTKDIQAIRAGRAPSITFNDLSTDTKHLVLARLSSAAGDLDIVSRRLAIAEGGLAGVSRTGLIPPLRSAADLVERELQPMEKAASMAAIAARLLPSFAGLEAPRTTLLLFLNNDEMRPGGGFIGVYGTLTMRNGDITSLVTRDAYALDSAATASMILPPPSPLTRYLGLDRAFFRDANWSPDFALSSRSVLDRFRAQTLAIPPPARAALGATLDIQNVVGFTPDFAASLLGIVGPITAGGVQYRPDNIPDLLEEEVEFGFAKKGIAPSARKEVIADLVSQMKDRLFGLPLSKWPFVVEAVSQAISHKDFVIYSDDQERENVLTRVGWGGRVLPPLGDAVMFVDANLGSLKSDPAVRRELHYAIKKDAQGRRVATLTMVYHHIGSFDARTTRYRTYARAYVPVGSQLLRVDGSLRDDKIKNPTFAPGDVEIGVDLGFTTFGTFTSIEPGETRALTFEYVLPEVISAGIAAGHYDLTVFKQIGADTLPLTLEIDFDKKLKSATPAEDANQWYDDLYRLNTSLSQDRIFHANL